MPAGTIAAAAAVFAGTDIDDLVVLTVLFLGARATGVPSLRSIVLGQYAGIAGLVAISAAAAAGLVVVPEKWVGLLGLVPLALGIRALVRPEHQGSVAGTGWWSVAALTVANGADNLAVYIPLFRTVGWTQIVVSVATFAVMVGVWLALASWLGGHKRIVAAVERSGRWLVPVVFCGVGVLVIVRSGLLS